MCYTKKNFYEDLKEIIDSSNLILDIGCGNAGLNYIKNYNKVIGLDINLSLLKKNKYKYKIISDIENKLPINPNNNIDFISIKYIFEHLNDCTKAIKNIEAVINKKTYIYVVVPKYYAFQDVLYRFLGKICEILKIGKQAHIQKFTFGSLCQLFYDNNFYLYNFIEESAGLSFLDKNKNRKFFKKFILLFLNFFKKITKKNLLEKNEMHFIFVSNFK